MQKSKLGVLLIHGWTGSTVMMRPLVEPIQQLGLPLRIPVLTGGDPESEEALKHVKWQDWLQDGEDALLDLANEAHKIVIVGHSMGGMIGLRLAADYPDLVDSVVTAGTPGRMKNPFAPGHPLHYLFLLLWRFIPPINKGAKVYADPELSKLDDSPDVVPVSTVKQLFDFLKTQKEYLDRMKVPLLILHSRSDSAVLPESAQYLFEQTATPVDQKRIRWFERTDHGMFLDLEAQEVIEEVVNFVEERIQKNAV